MQHGRKVCVAFFFMLPLPKICAAISKEKRRGVLMVKSGIEKNENSQKIGEYSLRSLDESEFLVYKLNKGKAHYEIRKRRS